MIIIYCHSNKDDRLHFLFTFFMPDHLHAASEIGWIASYAFIPMRMASLCMRRSFCCVCSCLISICFSYSFPLSRILSFQIHFILCTHAHTPLGHFDWFESLSSQTRISEAEVEASKFCVWCHLSTTFPFIENFNPYPNASTPLNVFCYMLWFEFDTFSMLTVPPCRSRHFLCKCTKSIHAHTFCFAISMPDEASPLFKSNMDVHLSR